MKDKLLLVIGWFWKQIFQNDRAPCMSLKLTTEGLLHVCTWMNEWMNEWMKFSLFSKALNPSWWESTNHCCHSLTWRRIRASCVITETLIKGGQARDFWKWVTEYWSREEQEKARTLTSGAFLTVYCPVRNWTFSWTALKFHVLAACTETLWAGADTRRTMLGGKKKHSIGQASKQTTPVEADWNKVYTSGEKKMIYIHRTN